MTSPGGKWTFTKSSEQRDVEVMSPQFREQQLPILGPTAVVLMQHLAGKLNSADKYRVAEIDLACALGVQGSYGPGHSRGAGQGRRAPANRLSRALRRLEAVSMLKETAPDEVEVASSVNRVNPQHIADLHTRAVRQARVAENLNVAPETGAGL